MIHNCGDGNFCLHKRTFCFFVCLFAAAAGSVRKPQKYDASKDAAILEDFMLPRLAGLPSYTKMEDPMPYYLQAARAFRACVQHRIQDGKAVCCVCARLLPLIVKNGGPVLPNATAAVPDASSRGWHEVPPPSIPNKHLLVTKEFLPQDADVALYGPSAAMPREGLTRYTIAEVDYCLDPDGITTDAEGKPQQPRGSMTRKRIHEALSASNGSGIQLY